MRPGPTLVVDDSTSRVIATLPWPAFLPEISKPSTSIKDALSFPAKELVLLPITVLLGVLEPGRAPAAVENAANLTWKLGGYFREYARICSERDQLLVRSWARTI
jgi:hypothetical protein